MNLEKTSILIYTQPMLPHIYVGTGADRTISGLAEILQKVVGFKGGGLFLIPVSWTGHRVN